MDRTRGAGAVGSRLLSRLRHLRHPVLTAALVVLGVLLAGAVVDLLRIRRDVEAGRATLTSLSVDRLGAGLVPTVDGAADHLDHADHVATRSPFLAALGGVPLLRDQVTGVRDLTGAAAALGTTAREAATAIGADLDRAGSEPAARLALLETVVTQLDVVEARAGAIDLGSGTRLVGPLRRAREDVARELAALPARLADARATVGAVDALLRGPTRYLVLAANNAEMRAGAGMPLSGGVVTFADGDVTFGDFTPIANRFAGPIDRSIVPAAYASTYGQFKVGTSWLQTAVSPSFTTTGPIYGAMSAQFPEFGPVDGVLEVDAVALAGLLEVIGPVRLGGVEYTAANVAAEILHENYLRFDDLSERGDRLEVQGELARAIFDALSERDVDVAALATALRSAAAGRHLLAYADDPAVQALWESVGATGALPPEGLMVAVQNIAANKLDWYLRPQVTMTAVERLDGRGWKVRLTVLVANPVVDDTNAYIDGTHPDYRDGLHRALVSVYLPAAATDVRSLDEPWSESGLDPPLKMAGKRVLVPRGEEVRVALEFTLPAAQPGVVLLPAARVAPTTYRINGTPYTDAVPTLAIWAPAPAPDRPVAAPAVAALALGAVLLLAVRTAPRWRPEIGRVRPR